MITSIRQLRACLLAVACRNLPDLLISAAAGRGRPSRVVKHSSRIAWCR